MVRNALATLLVLVTVGANLPGPKRGTPAPTCCRGSMSCCTPGGSCAAAGRCPLARAMRAASAHAAAAAGRAPVERFLPWRCGDTGPAAVTAQHDPWVPAVGASLPVASGSIVGLAAPWVRPLAVTLSPPYPPPRAGSAHPAS